MPPYLQLRMMEVINPWMYWVHLSLAVGLAKLWDQLGWIIWGESMGISGTNFIIIAILLGILHEIKVQSAMLDIHWSQGHEEFTEIKYEVIDIKSEIKDGHISWCWINWIKSCLWGKKRNEWGSKGVKGSGCDMNICSYWSAQARKTISPSIITLSAAMTAIPTINWEFAGYHMVYDIAEDLWSLWSLIIIIDFVLSSSFIWFILSFVSIKFSFDHFLGSGKNIMITANHAGRRLISMMIS